MIFSSSHPELIDKNGVKYPIEDGLLLRLPQLHGATTIQPKPQMKQIAVPS
jgi:hypothetical protein